MSDATTIFHIYDRQVDDIERALGDIFAREGREQAPRVEGTYSAVLERVVDPDVEATYRYLLLRPRATGWTTLIELGLRAEGLEVELSRALGGASVIAIFTYGEVVAGYRVARAGAEVDRYLSDPTAFEDAGAAPDADSTPLTDDEIEALRGRPERFADLLPPETPPDDFVRVVLRPGWWEERDAAASGVAMPAGGGHEDDLVDEVDRARCIGLALEVWAPDNYPLAGDLKDIANAEAGPAIALAWR
ncbi:MAG TPA: hypothetical protein VF808_15370 [Ktedonobacterales bacterium]